MDNLPEYIILHSSGIYVDTRPRNFHGYTIKYCGEVIGKRAKMIIAKLKKELGEGK